MPKCLILRWAIYIRIALGQGRGQGPFPTNCSAHAEDLCEEFCAPLSEEHTGIFAEGLAPYFRPLMNLGLL